MPSFPQFILAAPLKQYRYVFTDLCIGFSAVHSCGSIEATSFFGPVGLLLAGFPQFILAAPLKLIAAWDSEIDQWFSAVHSCGSIEAIGSLSLK